MRTKPADERRARRAVHRINCEAPVIAVDASSTAGIIVAGTRAGVLHRIVVVGDSSYAESFDLEDEIWCVSTDDTGTILVAGTADQRTPSGALHVFVYGKGRVQRQTIDFPVRALSLSRNGRLLAVATWNGKVLVYELDSRENGFVLSVSFSLVGAHDGVYGITINNDGAIGVSVYRRGVFFFRHAGARTRVGFVPIQEGIYDLTWVDDNDVVVATGSGGYLFTSCSSSTARDGRRISARPVYTVAATGGAELIVVAGVDSVLRSLTRSGRELWSLELGGEVWSAVASSDGRRVVAGSADGFVHLVTDQCGNAGSVEFEALADMLSARDVVGASVDGVLHQLSALGRSAGVEGAALRLLTEHAATATVSRDAIRDCAMALSTTVQAPDLIYLGEVFELIGDLREALSCYQRAAASVNSAGPALLRSASCLALLGLNAAEGIVRRRAAILPIDNEQVRLLYDLASVYETRGNARAARYIYEVVAAWDVGYRDCLERAMLLRADARSTSPADMSPRSRMPLVGPDAPSGAPDDPALARIVDARLGELNLGISSELNVLRFVSMLEENGGYDQPAREELPYDIYEYLKYEYGEVSDTAKKHLEMLTLVSEIELSSVVRSLDIGTATCRYPRFLRSLGVDAFGLDLSAAGFLYQRDAKRDLFRKFVQGDGRRLPFAGSSFDLVTCMMGTFNHLSFEDRVKIVAEARRVLRPGGVLAVGAWDTSCSYQGYLSIYSDVERKRFNNQALSRADFEEVSRESGFEVVKTVPFNCFPDAFVGDVGVTELDSESVRFLAEIDLATRARLTESGGQMFVGIARTT